MKQVHINPVVQRVGLGSRNKLALCPRCRDRPGSETSAWRADSGTESGAHSPATHPELPSAQASRREAEGSTQHPPSKFRPAAQGGSGEQKPQQWSQGPGGDWRRCRYAESATLKQLRKQMRLPRKPNHCPKACWPRRHSGTYYWTRHCLSERGAPIPSARAQAQAPPTRGTSQDTTQALIHRVTLRSRELRLWKPFKSIFPFAFFLFFSFINHTVYSPPTYLHLHTSI